MKIFTRIRESVKGREFFLKYFSSYLIIFSIPLILAIFTYHSATVVISRQCSDQVKNILRQTRDITDTHLQELKSISLTLKNNEHIIDFQREWAVPGSQGDIFSAYIASHNIPKYEVINSAIENTKLFLSKPDCCFVLGVNNAVRYTNNLNKLHWDNTSMSYADFSDHLQRVHFYEQFFTVPSEDVFSHNVYFLSNLHSFYKKDHSAVIVIKLSDDFFADMLRNLTLNQYGTSFILTENNEPICSYQGKNSFQLTEEKLEELLLLSEQNPDNNFQFEGNEVNLVRSDFNGWTYYSMIPKSVILKDLTAMRELITIATAIVIIAGVYICFLLTRRQSKPLKNMIGSLTSIYEYGYFDSTDHFMFLENAVTALVDRNSSYQEMFDREVLRQLLLDDRISSARFEEKLAQSSIQLNNSLYIISYLHIHNLKDTKLLPPQQLTQRLKDSYSGKMYPLVIDEYNMVFLAVHQPELADSTFPIYLKETLITLGTQILQETNCHVDFYLSEPMRHYENVPRCYEQCKKLARNVYKKNDIFVYTSDDLPPFQQIYRYTIDQEIQLIQLIQHGSADKLRMFLDDLYRENFETLILSEGMKQDLITSVQRSIQRNLSNYQSDPQVTKLLAEINHENTFDDLYLLLFQLREAVHTSMSSTAKSDTDNTNQKILDYMQNNYGNNSLNLYYMCEALSISEQTASRFFQEFGSSFSTYLEKVRIENACSLLVKNDLTIKAISEKVGYSSDVSFRRAFKRVLGVSPSEFIKNNHLEI